MLAGWSDDWHLLGSGLRPNSPDDETNVANRSALEKHREAMKQSITTLGYILKPKALPVHTREERQHWLGCAEEE